jgi:hypothetical protein
VKRTDALKLFLIAVLLAIVLALLVAILGTGSLAAEPQQAGRVYRVGGCRGYLRGRMYYR